MRSGDYVIFNDRELHGVTATKTWIGVSTQGAVHKTPLMRG